MESIQYTLQAIRFEHVVIGLIALFWLLTWITSLIVSRRLGKIVKTQSLILNRLNAIGNTVANGWVDAEADGDGVTGDEG